MSGFENFSENTAALEREIVRRGVALGIDWTNESQLRALAREALTAINAANHRAASGDPLALAKAELFGLAGLMLKTMQESADEGLFSHGGPAWKAFARALWHERSALADSADTSSR
ncbi:MAG: hypothetical protein HGA47_15410 [Zoogloea sp.]|nr:hypothetical protein [Zoogloea sp.]